MLELKQELEALADQWHNYIGGGTMTNKEHAKKLREIIAKYDFAEPQTDEVSADVERVLSAIRGADGKLYFENAISSVPLLEDSSAGSPESPKE